MFPAGMVEGRTDHQRFGEIRRRGIQAAGADGGRVAGADGRLLAAGAVAEAAGVVLAPASVGFEVGVEGNRRRRTQLC